MAPATLRRLSLLLIAGALAFFGIAGSGSAPRPTAASGPTVIVPGRPGEPAKVQPADQVKAPDSNAYSATDVWFVRMMIPHHTQAIEMASLAAGRASNPQIVAIAERIKAAQGPEILLLRAWLKKHGLGEKAEDAAHDHTTMPGMQTPEALRALANAKGDQFDRMFVAMMSAHHQGAIDMAGLRLRSGGDIAVERLANAVGFEQEVEITRMHEILR
jgi:uncharacterized protein (DUF305 family)